MTAAAPDELLAEAARQLAICNACRYCEGYCAVFPALERRRDLGPGDVAHLASLCHDCGACLQACMYAPPHEFAVDPPRLLSEIRGRVYDQTLRASSQPERAPARVGRRAPWGAGRGRAATLAGLGVALALVAGLAVLSEGASALWQARHGATSPYRVIAYPVVVAVTAAPFVWALLVLARAGARSWRRTRGPLRDLAHLGAWRGALADASQLRYLKGGGAGCPSPGQHRSAARRHLHAAVVYGFGACLVATIAAGIEQDGLGIMPPYPWLSVPVVAGTAGGIALLAGCIGLAALRAGQAPTDPAAGGGAVVNGTDPAMQRRQATLLGALAILAATGLATLLTRRTAAFGPVLVVHLAAVAVAFAVAPLTAFTHALYRLLALVQDRLEQAEEDRDRTGTAPP